MPKISIVLAVFNGENDVRRCIESLRRQTFSNIEIICVDDGSTDRTLAILRELEAQDSRIKVFEQGINKKLLLAIKRGVKEATGDYIMFIDDDDWYEDFACERVVEIFEKDNPDLICFGTNVVEAGYEARPERRKKRIQALRTFNFRFKGKNALCLPEVKGNYIWNKAYKSEIVKKAYNAIPDYEMTYHSDVFACRAMLYYSKSIVSISEKLTNYNYCAGTTAETAISAEKYEYILKCRSTYYEKGVIKFLSDNGATRELEEFNKLHLARVKGYIRDLYDRVAPSEYDEAYKRLLKYVDEDTIKSLLVKGNNHGDS